jgi:hypothetical protein
MPAFKIDTCKICSKVFTTEIKIMDNQPHFTQNCKFCRNKQTKIKRIKEQILDLEYQSFLMDEPIINN